MASTVSATFTGTLRLVETHTLTGPTASTFAVDNNTYGLTATLNASSTPTATKCWASQVALVTGALTLDLTALTDASNSTFASKTFLGLKVQAILLEAPADNGAAITLVTGASNGIDLLGASDWKIVVEPGQRYAIYLAGTAPAVASGDRTIDLSGTGTDKLNIAMVAGA